MSRTLYLHAPASLAAAAILLIPAAPCQGGATLKALGDLSFSTASGVSADGSAVVGTGRNADDSTVAFRWTSAGGTVGLGDLPGGAVYSGARGVSGDGSTVVGDSTSSNGSGGSTFEAFRWTSGGGMVGLGDLRGGAFVIGSVANGVSDDGSIVVGRAASPRGSEAFRWTSGGGMVGLGDLPSRPTSLSMNSIANAISPDGSVIVGRGRSASGEEAFRWTSGGGMVGLGVLPGGAVFSTALAVSVDGSTVVGVSASALGNQEAFRWTSAGGMVGLGLPDGAYSSKALGVSGDGSIIVGEGTSGLGLDAFFWTSGDGMQRLWDVLLAHGLDPAADGWTEFETASAISPDGSTIVGNGRRNGIYVAYVAVVPQPNIPPLPELNLSKEGLAEGTFRLRWPTADGAGYILEYNDDLTELWQIVIPAPTVVGSDLEVLTTPGVPRRFFRLRLPPPAQRSGSPD